MFAVWTLQSQGSAGARPAALVVGAGLGAARAWVREAALGVARMRVCAHAHLRARAPPSRSRSASGDCSLAAWVQPAGGRGLVPGGAGRMPAALCPLPGEHGLRRKGEDSLALGHLVAWVTALMGCSGGCCRVCHFPDDGEKSEVCRGRSRRCAPRGPAPSLRLSRTRVLGLAWPLLSLFLFIGDRDSVVLRRSLALCCPTMWASGHAL